MKKFPHNQKFDSQFAKIENITWYPYIGQNFESESNKRIIVYAHNIPFQEENFDNEVKRTSSKTFFANVLDEYTFINENWSASFRNFIKGAVGLTSNYSNSSSPEILTRIAQFVRKIAYTNFIDGLVKTNSKTNVYIPLEQIERSKKLNLQILQILNITHCICWGKEVYNHVCSYSQKPIKEEELTTGFGRTTIQLITGQTIKVLKIFHPSMPNFRHLQKTTHDIFSEFLEKY